MVDFQKPIPSYINQKQNIIRLIIFTSLFALVFINMYSPFGADRWYTLTSLEFFTYSSLTILTGVLVVVISRILLYHFCKKHINKYLAISGVDRFRNFIDGACLCSS